MWPQDIDLSLDNQCRAVWAELSSDFGWSVEQPGRGPFWAVGVGGFSLVSRATRLGATMGDLGRRISAGQWGNQAGGHSGRPETADFRWSVGQPGRALLRVPRAPQPPGTQAGPLGPRKVRWSVRATIPPAPASPPAPPWLCLFEELS